MAAARFVFGMLAVPLVPLLWKDHFLIVVLLRPTKEVLLVAGFMLRTGQLTLGPLLASAVPLVVVGIWVFFGLGRAYREEIAGGDLPGLGGRLLPVDRIQRLQVALRRDATRLVFIGRLALFPSTLVGAAAGSSGMPVRRFLGVDALGAIASVAEVLAAGYLLGATYREAGPWLTAIGFAALVGALLVLGKALRGTTTAGARTATVPAAVSPP